MKLPIQISSHLFVLCLTRIRRPESEFLEPLTIDLGIVVSDLDKSIEILHQKPFGFSPTGEFTALKDVTR